ncbi:MAG: patatin-like phospholipase family protein [Betaproteobacteria bacterium]
MALRHTGCALRSAALILACGAIQLLSGCAETTDLPPIPADLIETAHIPGYGAIRQFGDAAGSFPLAARAQTAPPQALQLAEARGNGPLNALAISGGGANGAFAAGLLLGWTKAGTRPEFQVVTGVSVGALAAPFALLGPRYDSVLRELFTRLSGRDIVTPRNRLLALFGDSLFRSRPLETLIARYFDDAMLRAVAAAHRQGRRLFVATTSIYAGRQVIWDIGAIADSGQPDALALVHRVLLASASVPILFQPVYFEVEANGHRYNEMHVDGGITRQVFMGPPQLDWTSLGRTLGTNGNSNFYVIRNGRVQSEYMVMPPRLAALGEHAMFQLTQSLGIGDLYMIYLRAQQEHARFHAAWIGADFAAPWEDWHDPQYVGALFKYGYAVGTSADAWHRFPPGMSGSK